MSLTGKNNQHISPQSDITISQAAALKPIMDIAWDRLGIAAEHVIPFGKLNFLDK